MIHSNLLTISDKFSSKCCFLIQEGNCNASIQIQSSHNLIFKNEKSFCNKCLLSNKANSLSNLNSTSSTNVLISDKRFLKSSCFLPLKIVGGKFDKAHTNQAHLNDNEVERSTDSNVNSSKNLKELHSSFTSSSSQNSNVINHINKHHQVQLVFEEYSIQEAKEDPYLWAAAWLRAESYCEDQPYVRFIDSYKKRFAEQEFHSLKKRTVNQYGMSIKCICYVAVANEPTVENEKNIHKDVDKDIIITIENNKHDYENKSSIDNKNNNYKKNNGNINNNNTNVNHNNNNSNSMRLNALEKTWGSLDLSLRKNNVIHSQIWNRKNNFIQQRNLWNWLSPDAASKSKGNKNDSNSKSDNKNNNDNNNNHDSEENSKGHDVQNNIIHDEDDGGDDCYAYISNVCVKYNVRRKKIALSLLLIAVEQAKQWGLKEIFVHVNSSNFAALNLYKKTGFRVVEDHPFLSLSSDGIMENTILLKLDL